MTPKKLRALGRFVKLHAVYKEAGVDPAATRLRVHRGTDLPEDDAKAIRSVLRGLATEIRRIK